MADRYARILNRIGLGGIAFGLGIVGLNASLYTVDPGHRGLIFDYFRGVLNYVSPEGTHFRIPLVQNPIMFDVRTTPRNVRSDTGSKDLQKIQVHLRLLYRPDIQQLKKIYVELGLTYDESVLPLIGTEVSKAVIAQFNAEELVTQRDNVSRLIRTGLVERASTFGIILEDVALVHLGFSKEYTSAIEHKQVAQQVAEKQKFIVERSRQEKLADVIIAEGETEAAKLIQEAMAGGTEFLELRKIEATKEIAETLAKGRSVTYLPSATNVLLNLPTSLERPPQRQEQTSS